MFTVVVANFNHERYVLECLNSLVTAIGSRRDVEVIVVDDRSTDTSGEMARKFCERNSPTFHYLDMPANSGVSAVRNKGIRHGIYPWIFYVDSDDYVTPNIFDVLEAAIRKSNGQHHFIHFGEYYLYQEKGEISKPRFTSPDIFSLIRDWSRTGNFVFSRAAFDYLGGFPEDRKFHWEDYWFYLNGLSVFGDGYPTNERLIYYRIHSDSRERSVQKNLRTFLPGIMKNFFQIPEVALAGLYAYGYKCYPEDFEGDYSKFPDIPTGKNRTRPWVKFYKRETPACSP